MKKIILILVLLISIFVLLGCGGPENSSIDGEEQTNGETLPPDNNAGDTDESPDEVINDRNDFSILIGDKKVSLFDWDYEVDLEDLLGEPTHEKTTQLGPGSDTFSGSYVKDLRFDGIELALFSPKDDGNDFYVLSMLVTDSKYPTPRGIKVGDNLEELNNAYPEIEPILDDRTDKNNMGYRILEGAYNYITFEVNDGVIVEIKIYHEFA